MTADKKAPPPAPPPAPAVDPLTVSDTKMCQLMFHAYSVWAYRGGLSATCIIAGLEAELAAWRRQFP